VGTWTSFEAQTGGLCPGKTGYRWREREDGYLELNKGQGPTVPQAQQGTISERVLGWSDLAEKASAEHDVPVWWILGTMHVESAGLKNATSPVGAGGLMQFMPATARMMDLRVDSEVDERYVPEKAIPAAAKLMALERNRADGDMMVATSRYNAGGPSDGGCYVACGNPWGCRQDVGHLDKVMAATNLYRSLYAGTEPPVPPVPPDPGETPPAALLGSSEQSWRNFAAMAAGGLAGYLALRSGLFSE